MLAGTDELARSFKDFRSSEVERFRVNARRARSEQLRELLADPELITLDAFNTEVWQIGGAELAGETGVDIFSPQLSDADARRLDRALQDGELRLRGNCIWGSATRVYGAPLRETPEEKIELVHQALRLLNDPSLAPIEKARRIEAVKGFGRNIATGLTMVFHPDEFAIYNDISERAFGELGFDASSLDQFERSAKELKDALGADDFLELDWFLYPRNSPTVPSITELDRTSRDAALGVLEQQIADLALRNKVAALLAQLIETAEEARPGCWTVNLFPDRWQFNVGATQVFWLWQGRICLVYDTAALSDEQAAELAQIAKPRSSEGSYRSVPTLADVVVSPENLQRVATLLDAGLNSAIRQLAPRFRRSPHARAYSPGIIDALVGMVGRSLPRLEAEGDTTNGEQVAPTGVEPLHLVVKWSARYGDDPVPSHRALAEEKGAVWWGLATSSDPDWRIAEEWIDELRTQIANGVPTHAFIAGPQTAHSYWQTTIQQVEYDASQTDTALVPHSDASLDHHLWLKLTDFTPTERDWLLRELDPARPTIRGKEIALGNQTNPLLVRARRSARIWWVNQGNSFTAARTAQAVWAPERDQAGNEPAHWRSMRDLRPGDQILHYAHGQLRAVSTVTSSASLQPRPDSTGGDEVQLATSSYRHLDPKVALGEIPQDWRVKERGPFVSDGQVKQGYLFRLSDGFAARLAERFPQLELGQTVGEIEPEPVGSFDLESLIAAGVDRGLLLRDETYANVFAALKSGKHVILTGPPGTAKTTLAEVIVEVAASAGECSGHLLTTATADWTTYETIGGLRPNSDGTLGFGEGHFLEAIRTNRWLIIDELNRSNFDRAFGQLFTVFSGQAVELPYERTAGEGRLLLLPEGRARPANARDVLVIPANWRVIATMNVFDKSLLFEMSFALMRRFAFAEVGSPRLEVFHDLITRELADDAEAAALAIRLVDLRAFKDLGPAVFIDIARFVRERRTVTPTNDSQVLFEAFYSYLLPQFEGIDQPTGERLFTKLRQLLGTQHTERLQRTLNTVLGLELTTAQQDAESDDVDLIDDGPGLDLPTDA